jgi:hypothetical protein
MEAYLKNGVVQSSDLDAVKVEQINACSRNRFEEHPEVILPNVVDFYGNASG